MVAQEVNTVGAHWIPTATTAAYKQMRHPLQRRAEEAAQAQAEAEEDLNQRRDSSPMMRITRAAMAPARTAPT